MKRILLCLALLAVSATPALAQAPNPVTQHYRDYRTAMAAGDLEAAETAGAAALAASEARDGAGGVTVVLAVNLAQVRLDRGRTQEALAPARRALEIAQANPEAGVSPAYARLLVARASFRGRGGTSELETAIAAADATGELPGETYEAAIALGDWSTVNNEPELSVRMFDIALRNAAGDDEQAILSQARARLGRAIARFRQDMAARQVTAVMSGSRLQRADDPNVSRTGGVDSALVAGELTEVLRMTLPLATRHPPAQRLTRAQQLYGSALAWRAVWDDYSETRGRVQQRTDYGTFAIPLDSDGRPPCRFDLRPFPTPPRPNLAIDFQIAMVSLWAVIGDDGFISPFNVAAAAGASEYVESVRSVAPRWRVEWAEGQTGCTKRMFVLTTYRFYVEDE